MIRDTPPVVRGDLGPGLIPGVIPGVDGPAGNERIPDLRSAVEQSGVLGGKVKPGDGQAPPAGQPAPKPNSDDGTDEDLQKMLEEEKPAEMAAEKPAAPQ
jgi:hypothetical protein